MGPVLELGEYDRGVVSVGEPSPADLDLTARLNEEQSRKLELRWLANGTLEAVSSSWVGVVELDAATVRIRPKFAGYELGVLKMLAYTVGHTSLRRLSSTRMLGSGSDLLDLICLLLEGEVKLLIRDGLIRNYVPEEASLPALRGSLRYREQATRRFGQLDTLECRFDDFHADIAENQLLRAGLSIAARLCSSSELTRSLRRLDATLAEVASRPAHRPPSSEADITYSRRNEQYRFAHQLCNLLIDRLGVDDLFASGPIRSFAFLIDMNEAFENFVSTVIAEALAAEPWRLEPRRRVRSVIRNRATNRNYASIVPDLALSKGRETVPVDAKYKLYGQGRKISTADIYQTFVYAYALSGGGEARAAIVYPASSTRVSPHLEIRQVEGPVGAYLTGLGVHLVGLVEALDSPLAWGIALAETRDALLSVLSAPALSEV